MVLCPIFMFTTNAKVMMAVTFGYGMATSIRGNVAYIYLMEMVPLSGRTLVGTFYWGSNVIFLLSGVVYIVTSKSKKMIVLGFVSLGLIIYASITALMLPESPKWLIEKKRLSDAKDSLQKIANWNRKPLKFDIQDFD